MAGTPYPSRPYSLPLLPPLVPSCQRQPSRAFRFKTLTGEQSEQPRKSRNWQYRRGIRDLGRLADAANSLG